MSEAREAAWRAVFDDNPEGPGHADDAWRYLFDKGWDAAKADLPDRVKLAGVIHRMVPDDEDLAHLCEDDDCLWYDIADSVLALLRGERDK